MNETTTQTTQAPKSRGFGTLPCPRCGEAEASIGIDLHDLTADEACTCQDCNSNFGLSEIAALVARWSKVLAWVDQAPAL